MKPHPEEKPAVPAWRAEIKLCERIGKLLAAQDFATRERIAQWVHENFGPKADG